MADEKKPRYNSIWTDNEIPAKETVRQSPAEATALKPSVSTAGSTESTEHADMPVRMVSMRGPAAKLMYADLGDSWASNDSVGEAVERALSKQKKPETKPKRTKSIVVTNERDSRIEQERQKTEEARLELDRRKVEEALLEQERKKAEETCRKENKKLEREKKRTIAKEAAARAAVRPCRNGYYGRVSKLKEMTEDSIPGRLSRWFNTLLIGDPYSPVNKGYDFFLTPDDPNESLMVVKVYGDLRLADGQRVCIKGRLQGRNTLIAQRIWWDTRTDSMSHIDEEYIPDWAPLEDSRARSAASLRILVLLGICLGVFLLNILIGGMVLPLLDWLAVEGPSLIVTAIFIVLGITWLRNALRRLFRW